MQRAQYNRIAFAHERSGIGALSGSETVLFNEHTSYQASRPPVSPGGEPDGSGCRVEPEAEPRWTRERSRACGRGLDDDGGGLIAEAWSMMTPCR